MRQQRGVKGYISIYVQEKTVQDKMQAFPDHQVATSSDHQELDSPQLEEQE